jgi:hypothetical protein
LGEEIKPAIDDTNPAEPSPLTVEANWISRKDVLTKVNKLGLDTNDNKLGVETWLSKLGDDTRLNKFGEDMRLSRLGLDTKDNKLGVDTWLSKFGVDTKLSKLGLEINPLIEETYPTEPSPLTVDANCVSRKEVLTKLSKLGLDIKDNKFGVETSDKRLGEEIRPVIDDTYPAEPRPLTVEANCRSKKDVLTKLNKLGDDTKDNKLGVET